MAPKASTLPPVTIGKAFRLTDAEAAVVIEAETEWAAFCKAGTSTNRNDTEDAFNALRGRAHDGDADALAQFAQTPTASTYHGVVVAKEAARTSAFFKRMRGHYEKNKPAIERGIQFFKGLLDQYQTEHRGWCEKLGVSPNGADSVIDKIHSELRHLQTALENTPREFERLSDWLPSLTIGEEGE